MSTWTPPRLSYHLRVFVICLTLLLLCLAGFLFGVRMEAVVPAAGVITARDLQDVRALQPGLAEPGWYEGELAHPEGASLRVRLDCLGNGLTDPACGPAQTVQHFHLVGTDRGLQREEVRFHRLEAGDELWPGQVVAVVRPVGSDWPDDAILRAPNSSARWQVVDVCAARFQAVRPGEVLARIVPLEAGTGRPRDLLARLELDEKHCGDLAADQIVRLSSTMYNPRVHGRAEAVLERLEPLGEPGPRGTRRFHAVARVTHAPFQLPLGSSCQAEIVVGRKPVYRIILEH